MQYTISELKYAVETSKSYSEVLTKLGKSKSGSSVKLIKQRIEQENLDISHFKYCSKHLIGCKKKPWKDILVHEETRKNREDSSRLRRALKESGRDYICEKCGNNGFWKDKEIILEIDHKDGNWQNNKPENLRFLCPNCHSQTDNFYNKKESSYCECGNLKFKHSKSCIDCGFKRNRKVKDRPSKEELEQDIKDIKYFVQIGKKYGVSDNAVRKWAKSYGILRKSC